MKNKKLYLIISLLGAMTLGGCNGGETSTSVTPEPTTSTPTTSPTSSSTTPEHIHKYEFDSFVWDKSVAGHWKAHAKLVCAYDPTHISIVDCKCEIVGHLTPTCTPGRNTYEATYEDHEEREFEEVPPIQDHKIDDRGFCTLCHNYQGNELDMKDKESVTFELNGIQANKTYFYMVKNLNPLETYRTRYEEGETEIDPPEGIEVSSYAHTGEGKQAADFTEYKEAKVDATESEKKFSQVGASELYFTYKAPESTESVVKLIIETTHHIDPDAELGEYGFCQGGHYNGTTYECGEKALEFRIESKKKPTYLCWDLGETSEVAGIATGFSEEDVTIKFYVLKEGNSMELLRTAHANDSFLPKEYKDSIDGKVYAVCTTEKSEGSTVPAALVDKLDEHFFAIHWGNFFCGSPVSIDTTFTLDDDNRIGKTWYTKRVQILDVDTTKTYRIHSSNDDIKNGIRVYQENENKEKTELVEIELTNLEFKPVYEDHIYFEVTAEDADSLQGQSFTVEIMD